MIYDVSRFVHDNEVNTGKGLRLLPRIEHWIRGDVVSEFGKKHLKPDWNLGQGMTLATSSPCRAGAAFKIKGHCGGINVNSMAFFHNALHKLGE